MTSRFITVNFYAAARDVLGAAEIQVSPDTVEKILAFVSINKPQLQLVLLRCSVLVNGELCRDRSQILIGGESIDILPPFAGG